MIIKIMTNGMINYNMSKLVCLIKLNVITKPQYVNEENNTS